jgi:GNAT superfamily N-acetyltransferase
VEPGYSIVAALPGHVRRLPAIERAAAALFPAEDLAHELRDKTYSEGEYDRARREGRLWVALSPGAEPVGFALVGPLDGALHLWEVDVHPEHGRRGIGAALVRRVLEWAREQGLPAVTLTTFGHLRWNAPFYQRLGFARLGPEELGPGLAAVLRREAEQGLDPAKRVAMRARLGGGGAHEEPA